MRIPPANDVPSSPFARGTFCWSVQQGSHCSPLSYILFYCTTFPSSIPGRGFTRSSPYRTSCTIYQFWKGLYHEMNIFEGRFCLSTDGFGFNTFWRPFCGECLSMKTTLKPSLEKLAPAFKYPPVTQIALKATCDPAQAAYMICTVCTWSNSSCIQWVMGTEGKTTNGKVLYLFKQAA